MRYMCTDNNLEEEVKGKYESQGFSRIPLRCGTYVWKPRKYNDICVKNPTMLNCEKLHADTEDNLINKQTSWGISKFKVFRWVDT